MIRKISSNSNENQGKKETLLNKLCSQRSKTSMRYIVENNRENKTREKKLDGGTQTRRTVARPRTMESLFLAPNRSSTFYLEHSHVHPDSFNSLWRSS